jgi:polyribonucleotide nucleotidyltransferase
MNSAIDTPDEMSLLAPRIITVKINPDQIGAVIGPKGKVINEIQDQTGAEISIEDDGTIYIGSTEGAAAEAAKARVMAIANPHVPKVGEKYNGTVVKIANFGAFITLYPGKDGLLHVSQIRKMHGGKRIENIEDVMKVGDQIEVVIGEIDEKGKLSLEPVLANAE